MNSFPYSPQSGGQLSPADEQTKAAIRSMQAVMESCPGKTAMSGVMGFVLGGAFGLFMASVCLPCPLLD